VFARTINFGMHHFHRQGQAFWSLRLSWGMARPRWFWPGIDMVCDVTQAFGHPELRARASAADHLADRISLRDHIVDVEIGAFQQERGTTQRISFNLVVEVAPHDAAQSDDVDKILSYDTLTEAIATELAAERLNLLETLAERIAQRILRQPQALRCFVRIEKLDRGPGALGVEIVRTQTLADQASTEVPLAQVVYLSNAALSSPHLQGWIDTLATRRPPSVLCVDLPQSGVPQVVGALAQRRIDLLAIEQNAWGLASRDRRCVVVGSRTELDWALKHGQMTVWAPSKIVLDTVDRPPVGVSHGPALAAWFAVQIGAVALTVIGETPPVQAGVAILSLSVCDPDLPTP